jgi:hypothetical protein
MAYRSLQLFADPPAGRLIHCSRGRRSNALLSCQRFETERTMSQMTSYETDIRPLFTERDIKAMSKAFDLSSYADVRTHAAEIYDRIRGIGGAVMPPPPPRGEGPWPQSHIDLFARWIAEDYPR